MRNPFPAAGRTLAFALDAWRVRLPSDCPLCGARARGGMLCEPCENEACWQARSDPDQGLPWRCSRCALPVPAHDSVCPDCDGRDTAFDRTIIAFDYVPPADALILQMKNAKRYPRADMLGNLLAEAVRHQKIPLGRDVELIPIPSSAASLRARGFNPANEIARAVGRDLRLAVHRDLLWRTREQAKQSTQGRLERVQATQGLYACSPKVVGRRFALVDDVMTTGSTMHQAASVLKQRGAVAVAALVVGRTQRPVSGNSRPGKTLRGPADA